MAGINPLDAEQCPLLPSVIIAVQAIGVKFCRCLRCDFAVYGEAPPADYITHGQIESEAHLYRLASFNFSASSDLANRTLLVACRVR